VAVTLLWFILSKHAPPMNPNRLLLVIDGDSFAHRAYHRLPKTIRRRGDRGAGEIVGFRQFLLQLSESERPRAVLGGWDTLDQHTLWQKLFPAYQTGRRFDPELMDQLGIPPELVGACGFADAETAGY
jgi:DNA polymerase-1